MKTIIAVILIFVLVFVINCCLIAQVTIQNNGIAGVPVSGVLYINGSLINTSGAALTNNGSMYVGGDITNNQAAMTAGNGTLYLNGGAVQTIAGTQTFRTNNLVTNNGAGIIVNNNLSVSGIHTFTNGLISTSATPNYLVYEAGASYTGSNDARHVNGWVKKIGSTDFTFPVGNTTYERSIALTNLMAGSEFNASYFDGPTPNIVALFSPLVLVDRNEYWRINRISGGNARVVMNWDNSKVAVPQVLTSNIRVAYYNNIYWASLGGVTTGNVTTTGTVTSNVVSTFNNTFTLGSTAYVLPLTIVSFTGNRSGSYNALNWTIANEVNVLHYELQRSTDAVNFTTINIQNAKNNNGTALYNYDDVAAMQSKVYYRLKCIDNNGQEKYSGIVIITAGQNSRKDLYVIKNPVSDKIDIYAGEQVKGMYSYTLANAAGQIVQTGTMDIKTQGVYSIKFNSTVATGIYMLVLRSADNILQKSILKE